MPVNHRGGPRSSPQIGAAATWLLAHTDHPPRRRRVPSSELWYRRSASISSAHSSGPRAWTLVGIRPKFRVSRPHRFEQAIEWADRALHDQPRTIAAMRVKVAALAYLGHLDAARAELSRVLAIDPKLTIAGFRAYAHFFAPEVLELYVTGLRLAGLSEE